jgi:methylenetetrahydrofolate dehydrogenase (NADP+) / methenyltetrahydrofolate cyclohydrolase
MILDGKKVSQEIKNNISQDVKILKIKKIYPKLIVLLVGHSSESKIYIDMKRKMCESLGINFQLIMINQSSPENYIIKKIKELNDDKTVNGILVQLPLPDNYDKQKILNSVSYEKDVDGFHTINAGKIFQNNDINIIPCTPQGCIDLIDHYKIDVEGINITIIGTSNLVGLPLSMLLLQRGGTVTLCNINTKDLKSHTKNADMLITCCGVPNLIKKDFIKEDTIIIDIGINYIQSPTGKKIVGDVDFEDVNEKCSMITPVPGGIGPMTVISLMKNLVKLTKKQYDL